ncbi:MAG: hypothetical protein ACRC2H_01250 [Silanimonas sp.]
MQPIDAFRLATHNGEYATWPLRTALLHADGRPTGVDVPGYVLRKQYQVGSEWLLVTDWDCPFEEATEVLLLDHRLRRVAHRGFGAPYVSWLLERSEVVGARCLRLVFAGDVAVLVTVRDASPWWSPVRWRSRLTVTR